MAQVWPPAMHTPPSPPSVRGASVEPSVVLSTRGMSMAASVPVPPSGGVGRHTLLVHVRPEQHSLVCWQLRPEAWQAQRPLLQSM